MRNEAKPTYHKGKSLFLEMGLLSWWNKMALRYQVSDTLTKILYIQPLHRIVAFMVLTITLWGLLGKKGKIKQWWSIINAAVFISIVMIILYMTIYSRSEATKEAVLLPFHSFIQAKEQPELYRSMYVKWMMSLWIHWEQWLVRWLIFWVVEDNERHGCRPALWKLYDN